MCIDLKQALTLSFFFLIAGTAWAKTETYRCTHRGFSSTSEIEIDIERPDPGAANQNVQVKAIRFLGYGNDPSYVTSPLRSKAQVLRIHLDLSRIIPRQGGDPLELSRFFQTNREISPYLSENGDYLSYQSREGLEPREGLQLRPYPITLEATRPSRSRRTQLEAKLNEERLRNSPELDRNIGEADHFALNSTPMRIFLNEMVQSANYRLSQCLTCPLLVGYDHALITNRLSGWINRVSLRQAAGVYDKCESPQRTTLRSCSPL